MSRKFFRYLSICLLGGSLVTGCQSEGEQAENIGSSMAPLVTPEGAELIPDHYIVVFKDSAARDAIYGATDRLMQESAGNEINHIYDVIPAFAAKLSPQAVNGLLRNPNVAYIEQDSVVRVNTVHSTSADGIDRVDQRTLPVNGQYDDYGRTGAGVHVYIIDTGIRTTHSEFTGRVGAGYDAVDNDTDPSDCQGHGTHVASTAVGTKYGIAKGATVHGVRVLNCQGSGTNSGVIAGVDWVTNNHVKPAAANMSLGGGAASTLDQAVANSVAAGVTYAVAAGNDNKDACNYSPAREASAITVAASDDADGRATFSNYGSCVDIFAPGVSILGAWYNSDTATNTISGTSMASPHVAGAAALFLQSNPGATPAQVLSGMINNANVNCISNVSGSPNTLLHNNFAGGQYDCGGGGGGGDTCEGYCGGKSASSCYCDTACTTYGDCCPDYDAVCNGGGGYPGVELSHSSLSDSQGNWKHYTLSVPSDAKQLAFKITGGSGDADMYVKFGSQPTTSSYDCRPYKVGNEETCSYTNMSTGTWYVSIRAYTSYSGVTLTGDYDI